MICKDCDYKTSSKRSMRDHGKCHEPINPEVVRQMASFKCARNETLKPHTDICERDFYTCSHCEFVTRHYSNLELHIKHKHSQHYNENRVKRSSSSHGSKKVKQESNKKRNKIEKLVYSKFQRLYECDRCDESFVREDSLKSHLRLHDELSNNNLKLSTAMTVLKLQKPVINQLNSKTNKFKKRLSHTFVGEQSESMPVSSEEEHTPRTLSSGNFCDYEQETDYEEPITDTGVSQTYYRHDQDDNLQSLNRISNHRRQLDFDADPLLVCRNSSNKRRSSETSSLRNDTSLRKLSCENVSEHSGSKRNKSLGDINAVTQRSVADYSRSQHELLHINTLQKKDISRKNLLSSESSSNKKMEQKNNPQKPRSETISNSQHMTQTEAEVGSQFVEQDGHITIPQTNEHGIQYQFLQQPQPICQVPNIQLVQNISLPLVHLPDGQIIPAYGSSQIIPEVNVEQPVISAALLTRPANENIQTIQLMASPNVGIIPPSNNHVMAAQNVPQIVELVDSLGNPVSAQFIVPSSVGTVEEMSSATLQTINITGIQDHVGVIEQQVMTLPIHVLDMSQNTGN